MSRQISRRGFLHNTCAAGAALGLFHYLPSRLLGREGNPGPNSEIRIGVIGTGGRSRQLISQVPCAGASCRDR